ncbi:MAG: hypothetical protein LBC96_02750 [Lachnospiraceae bacterium]|jgi:hypothetical protein|nr:hypothetical protein [Lachnospiraceae bacterium]
MEATLKPIDEAVTDKEQVAAANAESANNAANTSTAAREKALEENEEKALLSVSGYIFSTPEDADLARQEAKKIEYLDHKMNYQQPENILAVYNKVLENKMLKTPLGHDYLRRMQVAMLKGGIAPERITPIPIIHSYTPKVSGEITEGIARQRIERQLKKEKTESAKLTIRLRTAVLASLFLAVLVIAMFYITIQSDNPNILNYENALLNKYAGWEQELWQREMDIRTREREIGLE